MLAAAVAKSGDVAAVQRVIDVIADASQPEWQRTALLQGLDAGSAGARRGRRRRRGGRGGGGGGLPGLSAPGGRVAVTPGRGVTLPGEPAGLIGAGGRDRRDRASREERVGEAGLAGASRAGRDRARRSPRSSRSASTPGAEIYKNICMGCHQEDGRGKDKLGANLVDSPFVTAADASATIRILVGGKEGTIGLMPPLGPALSDEQIASALTYVRRSWGHTAPAVDPLNVMEVRGLSKGRTKPWTDRGTAGGRRRGGRGGL